MTIDVTFSVDLTGFSFIIPVSNFLFKWMAYYYVVTLCIKWFARLCTITTWRSLSAIILPTIMLKKTRLHKLSTNPDSMTTLAQRWPNVGPLADGWRWLNNVGQKSDHCQHATIILWCQSYQGIKHWPSIGPTLEYFDWSMLSTQCWPNLGPMSTAPSTLLHCTSTLPPKLVVNTSLAQHCAKIVK